jgi:hypothetical protein
MCFWRIFIFILIALEEIFSYPDQNLSEFKVMEIKLGEQEKQELERRQELVHLSSIYTFNLKVPVSAPENYH